jgi:hypothetical protein
MVSDGCVDWAKRLPQKTEAQAKKQTKRAIIEMNLPLELTIVLLQPWKPRVRSLVGRGRKSGLLEWNAWESHSCGAEVAFVTAA